MPRQYQENGLRRILGVVAIADDPPANVEHHRRVPLQEHGERRLGVLGRGVTKAIQQVAVAAPCCRPGPEQDPDLLHEG